MKKLFLFMVVLVVLSLSACKSKEPLALRYWETHQETMSSFDVVQVKTSVVYSFDGDETALESYVYQDNGNNITCMAAAENDPSEFEEYSAECLAIYGTFNGKLHGFVPYATESGDYPVHPLYEDVLFGPKIIPFFTDDDILEETDTTVRFRTSVYFSDLDVQIKRLVSSSYELDFEEIPVLFNAVYDKEQEQFTSIIIDNSDVMTHIYNTMFGLQQQIDEYYIKFEYTEYAERFNVFYPETDRVFDEDVNFFDDGDYYGYREFNVGDVIEGTLDYPNDQDIIVLNIPVGGSYNLTYAQSGYEESILFSVYDDEFAFLVEGIIEGELNELKDVYLYPGQFYIVLFTHHEAEGYKLNFERVQ